MKIFLKYKKIISGGGYLSAQELGRPGGAKGMDFASVSIFYIPPFAVGLTQFQPTLQAEEILIKKYEDQMILEAAEEDEDLQREFNSIIKELKSATPHFSIEWVTVAEVPADYVESDSLPSGLFIAGDLTLESDVEAEKVFNAALLKAATEEEKLEVLIEDIKIFCDKNEGFTYKKWSNSVEIRYKSFHENLYPDWEFGRREKIILNMKDKADKAEAIKTDVVSRHDVICKKNLAEGKFVELSTGEILVISGTQLRVPEWAMGHLIGKGGDKIGLASQKAGFRINLISVKTSEPRNAKAFWII